MFEHVFVTNTGATVRPYTVMVSFAGQMALVGLGVLAPLLYTDTLPAGWWAQQFSAPLVPPGRPAPQPLVQKTQAVPRARPANTTARLFEPVKYPAKASMIVDEEAPPAAWTDGSVVGVVGGTGVLESGPLSRYIGDASGPIPIAPPVVKPPTKAAAQEATIRVRVGGLVKAPVPILTPQPVYPALARQARIEGVVHLEAIVATNGRIQGVQLITGHPLLVAAAIAAVREWRYTPPTLNGDPVEMVMYVDVIFKMGR